MNTFDYKTYKLFKKFIEHLLKFINFMITFFH